MEILDLGNLLAYCILAEGVTIIMIKIDSLLKILGNLYSTILLDIVPLSLCSKYIGHLNELIGIIGEAPCPFTLGNVK